MIKISSIQQLAEEIAWKQRVVVLLTQPRTCVPCRQFLPHFERADSAVEEIKFLYVDLDVVPEVMVEYNLLGVPTVKLYSNGEYLRDVKAPQGALPFITDIRS